MYHSIINKHKNLDLNESTHTYTLYNSNIEFTSVTEFISSFFNPFDEYKIAQKLSTLKKYNHMSTEDILKDWENRRNRGTIVHKQIEEFLNEIDEKSQSLENNIDANISLDLKTKQGIAFLKKKCINDNNNLFSEIKIYSEELQIAGTIDLIIYNKKHRKIYLIDWKTNLEIKKNGYNTGIKFPTNNTIDCSYNKYQLQLSLYKYILEKFYNASVAGLYIAHLTDKKYNIMECVFQESIITEMVKIKKLQIEN